MNLFSAAQLIDSGCRVILDTDSCSIQDRRTKLWLVLAPGAMSQMAFGRLTGFVFLPLPPLLPTPMLLLPLRPRPSSSGSSYWSPLWLSFVLFSSSGPLGVCIWRCLLAL